MLAVVALRRPKSGGLAVALTSFLVVAFTLIADVRGNYLTEEGKLSLRPRVGHFSHFKVRDPISNVYNSYFDNVIRNNDKAMRELDSNDWRRARPTAELCLDFLMDLQVKSLLMDKPHEIVILDACLDWLFGDTKKTDKHLDVPQLSRGRTQTLKQLEKDKELRAIYENTAFKDKDKLPQELVDKLYKYVTILLEVHGANPFMGCHGHWLDAYNNFLDDVYLQDCDDEMNCKFYNLDGAAHDSYLRMIAESTIEAARRCYHVMQAQIRGLMESEYAQSTSPVTVAKRLRKNAVSKQLEKEKWTGEMALMLQMAEGVGRDSCINLGDAAVHLEKIKEGDTSSVDKFLQAVGEYADENTDKSAAASANDPYGRARFGRAMVKLCRPFIDHESFLEKLGGIDTEDQNTRKPFDFYSIIYSLVRLTNHEHIIGISKADFEDHVISNRWEAVYLSTLACQVIYTTWGTLDFEQNSKRFRLLLMPNARVMLAEWPIEVMSEKLPLIYPKTGSSGSSKLATSSVRGLFGVKKQAEKSDESDDEQQHERAQRQPPSRPAPGPARINQSALAKKPYEGMKIMAWETIELYFKLHGRLMKDLPDYYFEIYPFLLNDPYTTHEQQEYYKKYGTMGNLLK